MTSNHMLPDFNNIGASFTTTFVDETVIDLAERIIGGLILDPNAIERIDDLLTVDLFPLECQQKVVRAIKDLYASQKPVDLITVTMELDRRENSNGLGVKNIWPTSWNTRSAQSTSTNIFSC